MIFKFTHELTVDDPVTGKPVCIAECDGHADINIMYGSSFLPTWFIDDIQLDVLGTKGKTVRLTGKLFEQVKRSLMTVRRDAIQLAVNAEEPDDGSDNFEKQEAA